MNESIRTLIYVGVAGVVSLLAWAWQPAIVEQDARSNVGKQLFEKFKDPLAARSLKIVQFDEQSAALRTFEVAQKDGRWVIPSHGNYPADAENQLKDAASGLMNLEVLAAASEATGDHALYGVLEPDATKLKVGSKGVGTLVAMQDAQGNDLMRLIIGKEVQGSTDQRFVRKPSEEVVYVVALSLDKLPTDFEKWIEKDLLKLNAFDVARLTLKDYTLLPSPQGGYAFLPRMDATVAWSDELSSWNLENMVLHTRQGPSEQGLGDQEELNKQKLDDLKNALADFKIVDVARKPEGLGASLRVSADLVEGEATDSIVAFGFIPQPAADNKVDIFASNGEVIVDMKDGVQYVLRFGRVEGAGKSTADDEPAAPGEEKDNAIKLNRYLFVTAQLSPHTLKEPEYEAEPAGPAADAAKPADAEKADDEKANDEKAADEKAGDEKADDVQADAPGADPQKAERERIKRENQRKRDEYQEKRRKAEARVAELNARFADWYYVISEDVYKKVHLGRSDIIKEGALAKDEGFGVDAFRKLESQNLDAAPGSASPGGSPPPGGLPPFGMP